MKIGRKKLKTSRGKIITFRSSKARDEYERFAQALKHGWKPTDKRKKKLAKRRKKK